MIPTTVVARSQKMPYVATVYFGEVYLLIYTKAHMKSMLIPRPVPSQPIQSTHMKGRSARRNPTYNIDCSWNI